MTLKEQIMKLQTYKMHEGEDTVYVERDDVLKVLEQQPCEYAISRVDALKALDYDIKSFEFKSGVGRHMNEIANLLNTIYEIQSDNIKALPSVQSKTEKCKWIRYDYRTICPQNHDIDNPYWRIPENRMDALKYCPYCGKEIEVME